MHTSISNNKRKARMASSLVNKKSIKPELRQPVSTLTHSSREVALHFLEWREAQQNNSLIGHNNPPN